MQIQALIAARIAYEDFPIFRVLSAPRSNITIPADLAGKEIGVSLNTVIEYVTSRVLEAEGLAPEDIAFASVPSIPERFQLLMQGQLLVATLPDPLAQAAIQAGATNVIDDAAYPAYSLSVLSFSVDAIENKPEAIRRFLLAWDMAVQDLNADPEAYRALFLEKVTVPESVQGDLRASALPTRDPPDRSAMGRRARLADRTRACLRRKWPTRTRSTRRSCPKCPKRRLKRLKQRRRRLHMAVEGAGSGPAGRGERATPRALHAPWEL
ncbi:MAG: ABC transporter substrate-binding protein [Anaerolineae bacterium]|nr:ABC transporter substrate-binding protein [Anaerolineae bacterium]